jgi:hypothetical protein
VWRLNNLFVGLTPTHITQPKHVYYTVSTVYRVLAHSNATSDSNRAVCVRVCVCVCVYVRVCLTAVGKQ